MIEPGLRLPQVFRCFLVADQRPLCRGIDETQATHSKLLYGFLYLYGSTLVAGLPVLYCSHMNSKAPERWTKTWPPPEAANAPYGWQFVNDDEARTARPGKCYVLQAHFACGWGIEAMGRLDPNGKPVVTSFCLFPLDETENLSVNSNLLKELPAGELLAEVRSSIADVEDFMNSHYASQGREHYLEMISASRWPGRGVRASDTTYAALAFMYLEILSSGENKPIEALAELMECKRATASNRLADARSKNFLVSSKPGTSGGQLSEKSLRLLGLTFVDNEQGAN